MVGGSTPDRSEPKRFPNVERTRTVTSVRVVEFSRVVVVFVVVVSRSLTRGDGRLLI